MLDFSIKVFYAADKHQLLLSINATLFAVGGSILSTGPISDNTEVEPMHHCILSLHATSSWAMVSSRLAHLTRLLPSSQFTSTCWEWILSHLTSCMPKWQLNEQFFSSVHCVHSFHSFLIPSAFMLFNLQVTFWFAGCRACTERRMKLWRPLHVMPHSNRFQNPHGWDAYTPCMQVVQLVNVYYFELRNTHFKTAIFSAFLLTTKKVDSWNHSCFWNRNCNHNIAQCYCSHTL